MQDNCIPCGLRCFDSHHELCPYYKKIGVIKLNKTNCEFADSCKKDCMNEHCKNILARCDYVKKTESISDGDFLLPNKYKICGTKLK